MIAITLVENKEMARKEINVGTYDGLNVQIVVEDDSIPAGTNTVPGMVSFRNDNQHPITELEGQFNSKLNIMPSSFSFNKINPGNIKNTHILVNVPKSTKPENYEIKVDFDFKIDTPPATSKGLTVQVTKPIE